MKNKKLIYGFLVLGGIIGYYYYNIQKTGEGKLKDTRSKEEIDCQKRGGRFSNGFCIT